MHARTIGATYCQWQNMLTVTGSSVGTYNEYWACQFYDRERAHDGCYTPWTIMRHLVLIFSHHMYHRTVLTGLWLPYWTYALSRYLADTSCSHTFLIRIMFAQSRDTTAPLSITPLHNISCMCESVLPLYLQTLLLLTIHMIAHLSAYYCAAVPIPFAYASPYFMMTLTINHFT